MPNSNVIHMPRLQGLPPVINSRSRVLILGSFPGMCSLFEKEYYAYRYNQFWEIMEKIYNIPVDAEYNDRIKQILDKGIALWDVIESCERVGSSDYAIKNELPNKFEKILGETSKIQYIIFNGIKAGKTWKKHEEEILKDNSSLINIPTKYFPSTSPANAKKEEKFLAWDEIKSLI